MQPNRIIQHNVLDPWPLPDKSVHCIVTSPPYWNLRDYGTEGQIGLEKTPEEYIRRMVEIFRQAWRVLRDDGTLWVNIGDSYWSGKGKNGNSKARGSAKERGAFQSPGTPMHDTRPSDGKHPIIKAKDLVGIPWMLAFALRADGWYLRQDIIWHKRNPMPESVTDRCTKAHEYLFMFSKSRRYYYDAIAIRTPPAKSSLLRWNQNTEGQRKSDRVPDKTNGTMKAVGGQRKTDKQRGHGRRHAGFNDRWDQLSKEEQQSMGANKRSMWAVATSGFKEAHFATFPEDLITDPILAGCPPAGIVLDPFMGSGTTGLVALNQGRNFIGLEISHKYIKMAERRLAGVHLGA